MPGAPTLPKPARAVIFDLDGTLIDSLADIAAAANRMLARRGLPAHPAARYRGFIGEGVRRLVERALTAVGARATEPLVRTALAEFRAAYGGALVVETAAYPGIPGLLAQLRDAGVAMAVLSNKPDPWTRAITERLFPDVPFTDVRGQRAGTPYKPDPTAANALVEAMAQPVDQTAFVGDSPLDVATARAAGLPSVAVTWGFSEPERLSEANPTLMVADVEGLRAALCAGDE